MKQKPVTTKLPFLRPDGWHSTEYEDYQNATSDDERRETLLHLGYPADLEYEVKRLFAPSPQKQRHPKKYNWDKISVIIAVITVLLTIALYVLDKII